MNQQQMTLMFEPNLATRHRSLKDCIATGVYQRGISAVAGKIDSSPSHLSEALSGADRRKFDVDDLERYIEKTGDTSPILYLVAEFMRDPAAAQQEALARLAILADSLPGLMAAAGVIPSVQQKQCRK
jgi:hypothetical protein